MLEHVKLYEELFTGVKAYDIMKRHFKAYVTGYDGAADLRAELYETKSYADVSKVIQKYLQQTVE
jgi:tRNA-dihydrouridine synthase